MWLRAAGFSGGTSRLTLQTSWGNLPVSPDPFPRSASRTDASRLPQTPSTGPLGGRTLRVSFASKGQVRRAECDRVAGVELRPLDALAVDLHAVGRAEVDHPVRRALLPDLRMAPRDIGVGELDVAVARAPDDDAPLLHLVPRPVERQRHQLRLDPELLCADGLRGNGSLRLVDHGRARLHLRQRLARSRATLFGLHHARGDAELAHVEIGVGLHQDPRRRHERVLLAPRVLPQVLLELPFQAVLVPGELLAVAG